MAVDLLKCEETLKRIRQSYRDYFMVKGIPPERIWISQDTYDMLKEYMEEKYPGLFPANDDQLYGMKIIITHEDYVIA